MYERKVFDRFLTMSEERALFATVRKHAGNEARRDAAWMLLALHTGIRLRALTGLTVADARAARRSKHLTLAARHAKRKQAHRVYVNVKAQAALAELLAVHRAMAGNCKETAPLILSRRGRGAAPRTLQAAMERWCKLAGIRAATPHWLRHTAAKRIMETSKSDDPRAIVQKVLGHASINSTLIYTQPDHEMVQSALDAIA